MRRGLGMRAFIALLLGCASSVALVPMAGWTTGAVRPAQDLMLIRAGRVWTGLERQSMLVHWVNLETSAPLVNERADDGTIPVWAEPDPVADVRPIRSAAVAVGWPLPIVAASWRTSRLDQIFPPLASNEESGFAPKDALRRLLERDPNAHFQWLPSGWLIDTLVHAMCWFVLLEITATVLRARRVTPQAAAALRRG